MYTISLVLRRSWHPLCHHNLNGWHGEVVVYIWISISALEYGVIHLGSPSRYFWIRFMKILICSLFFACSCSFSSLTWNTASSSPARADSKFMIREDLECE